MTQAQKAQAFADLHVPGTPLVLCNIWDPGSAMAVTDAGATAIATGSWGVARANGYTDGQDMPLDHVLNVLSRIIATTDLPVTLDFEGGYTTDTTELAANTARVIATGAIGVNFEDQVINGDGLVSIADQVRRIAAMRAQANHDGVALFINARTDVFFKNVKPEDHPRLLPAAIERARAYEQAGASGLFVPGLQDTALIAQLCEQVALPVNVMMRGDGPDIATLAASGVARISQGPGPYINAMRGLTELAKSQLIPVA